MKKLRGFFLSGWTSVIDDSRSVTDIIQSKFGRLACLAVLIGLVAGWFVYVPIHELLHVAGCTLSGGAVTELTMGKEYGAEFLSVIFPFIKPQTTQYAGRLTGFEPAGDLGYLITDLAPYLLTIPGVMLLRASIKLRRAWILGPALLLSLAPFINLTGDFFEMGTIVATRIVDLVSAGAASEAVPKFWQMRSDDIFRLAGEIYDSPSDYGFNNFVGGVAAAFIILAGMIFGLIFAGWTYAVSRWISIKLKIPAPELAAGP